MRSALASHLGDHLVADVSGFLEKRGGSVKCMIGDLGPVQAEDLAEAGET